VDQDGQRMLPIQVRGEVQGGLFRNDPNLKQSKEEKSLVLLYLDVFCNYVRVITNGLNEKDL
jgi:hypothetical protein